MNNAPDERGAERRMRRRRRTRRRRSVEPTPSRSTEQPEVRPGGHQRACGGCSARSVSDGFGFRRYGE